MSSAEPPLGAGPRAQPAWKREILERKRAKLAGAAAGETEPAAAVTRGPAGTGERLVVAESLGPLRENPFMRLENERRRLRQGLPGHGPETARPLQQLLELYSAVPGIRTIRADNILIIESQPDAAACFADGEALSGRRREPPASSPPRRADPLRELLARRGAAVAEIRADQVLVYEAAEAPEPPEAAEPGTVSRLLEKFGQRPRGRRRRGGEVPAGTAATPRAGAAPAPAAPGSPHSSAPPKAAPTSPRPSVPKAAPASPRAATPQPVPVRPQPAAPRAAAPQPAGPQAVPASPRAATPPAVPISPPAPMGAPKAAAPQANCFLHKIGSNSFTVTPRGLPPPSRVPEPPPPSRVPEPTTRSVPPKVLPVPSTSAANARRPKPEEVEVAASPPPSASLAPSATQPLSASAPRAGGSFEIHPAPKPDLAAIPAHDLQAQALAKLRLNSRNSFLFVPRRDGGTALPAAQSNRTGPPPSPQQKVQKEPPRVSAVEQEEPIASPPAPLDPLVPVTYIDDIVEPDGELSTRAARTENLDQPGGAGSELDMDISSVPLYRPHSPGLHQRGGNTFTVVPKRKPGTSGPQGLSEAGGRPQREEEEEDEESKGRSKAVENADGPQVGATHKKRYPTVNEIEVIGGYLALERSCMSKTGSRRKKMKISFNETSLQTMFEYPSESSLAEEEEEEEEEEGRASETEDKSRPFHIPRPNSILHPNAASPADLSSYTPKHSVKFSEWQEQKYEEMPAKGPLLKEADGNQVMLTPAEKGGLSDFSSEPALYF
ncbi:taperin isoform X2 [Coturnix japonica]|uniref:Taperin n=1 Tax=Coturnix japonica TaxID=93934 RepID=A0A8C2U4X8_COTJA|nr:taperin isoform X2 [Coturnix japonica]